ncbi:MAG: T9SS type A sorting domain-containing protein, partial [Limisphaerales bacterium]
PTTEGDYYYRVTRWQNNEESPPSNAIRLTASPTAVEDRQIEKHAFLLSEPFPNPTSAGVLFTARTDKQMQLGFSIYNLLGQKVFSKPSAGYPAGEHPFFWNGQDASGRRLASGLYLLRFQAGGEVLVKKITLLR